MIAQCKPDLRICNTASSQMVSPPRELFGTAHYKGGRYLGQVLRGTGRECSGSAIKSSFQFLVRGLHHAHVLAYALSRT
jgi:hypothetical protein